MKKLLSIILSLTMIFASTTMAAAQENRDTKESKELIISIPREEPAKLEKEAIDSYLNRLNMPATNDYEYKAVLVGTQTNKKVRIGYAGNQPVNGTSFASPGGFYWTDGGYDVSVSVSFAYELFSVSVSAGKTGASGTWISSPYINIPCKLLIYKDIEVSKYQLYRRLIMRPELGWEYTGDSYTTRPTLNYLEVVQS